MKKRRCSLSRTENDQPLKMRRVFNKSSSDAKKIYKTHLGELCEASGDDVNDAPLALMQQAGARVLAQLMQEHKRPDFAERTSGVAKLKAQLHRVRLVDGEFEDKIYPLAEKTLTAGDTEPASSP